jgi:tetratricopeptide (TPR) repeat protein
LEPPVSFLRLQLQFYKPTLTLVRIGGCIATDNDFDGVSYQPVWPGTGRNRGQDEKNHSSPILFTSPRFNLTQNYSRVAFEADLPRIEAADFGGICNRTTGANCVNPPPGSNFYPFYSTADPKHAEELLRESLTADIYCGPAHNNLGVLCLREGRLYEAANEFEWARKLMPGHPDPRINLSLCFEHAGRADEAIAMSKDALAVYPGHIGAIEQLASLQLRHDKADDHTAEYLATIALQGESEKWREWAREQALRLGARKNSTDKPSTGGRTD